MCGNAERTPAGSPRCGDGRILHVGPVVGAGRFLGVNSGISSAKRCVELLDRIVPTTRPFLRLRPPLTGGPIYRRLVKNFPPAGRNGSTLIAEFDGPGPLVDNRQ